MREVATEILTIVLLVLTNGFLAMAEIALVSVRKARFRKLAEKGDSRARAALELVETPTRFLSTVQVGITLIGVFAGAFGGVRIANVITAALKPFEMLQPYAQAIGIGTAFSPSSSGNLFPNASA